MQNFIERHDSQIKGVISCFDRIILNGTIPGICYADPADYQSAQQYPTAGSARHARSMTVAALILPFRR